MYEEKECLQIQITIVLTINNDLGQGASVPHGVRCVAHVLTRIFHGHRSQNQIASARVSLGDNVMLASLQSNAVWESKKDLSARIRRSKNSEKNIDVNTTFVPSNKRFWDSRDIASEFHGLSEFN